MRKFLFLLILSAFAVSCTSVNKEVFVKNKESMQKALRIAVIPFTEPASESAKGSGVAVADALTSEIVKIAHWNVVERSQLEKIMDEKALNLSGMTDADFTKVAQILKTDYIIVGNVAEFEYERKFTNIFVPKTKLVFKARIINSEDGSIVGTVKYNRETGKYACLGCFFLGFYYIPVALLSEENKYEQLDDSAKEIVKDISSHVTKKSGCF